MLYYIEKEEQGNDWTLNKPSWRLAASLKGIINDNDTRDGTYVSTKIFLTRQV